MHNMTILITIRTKGGPGSGNWGHRGIPGKVGGSSPRGVGLSPTSGKDWLERYEKRTGKKHPKAARLVKGQESYGLIKDMADGTFSAEVNPYNEGSDKFLEHIQKAQGFDALPQTVSDLDDIAGDYIHRGFSSPEFKDNFTAGKLHGGTGLVGSGTHFSTDPDVAKRYGDTSKISAKLDPTARVLDQNDIGPIAKAIRLYWSKLSSEPYPATVARNVGRLAALAGYDAVKLARGIILVLNRSAVMLEQ